LEARQFVKGTEALQANSEDVIHEAFEDKA
jgi:hypothetical protein